MDTACWEALGTWVAAVAAAVLGIFFYRQARSTEKLALKQLTRANDEDALRRVEYEQRFASGIQHAAIYEGALVQDENAPISVRVNNTGDVPVYDVVLPGPFAQVASVTHSVLFPGGTIELQTERYIRSEHLLQVGHPDRFPHIEIYFTDVSGKRWKRDPDGTLTPVPT